VSGTIDRPEGTVEARIDRAVLDGEPIDGVSVRVNYLPASIDVPRLEVRARSSVLDATARYDHKPGVLAAGDVQVRIANGRMDLGHIRHAQALRQGISGIVQLTADGKATIATGGQILPHSVNLNFSAKGLAQQGKDLGDLTLAAVTSGSRLHLTLASNLGGASIGGNSDAQLGGDYPMTGQVTIHSLNWQGLQPLLGSGAKLPSDVNAFADGEVAFNGPALHAAAMSGRLQLSRIQFTASTSGLNAQTVTVQNQGPVVIAMDHGTARIESLHLAGPLTDVQIQGSAALAAQTLQATLNAHTDLSVLQRFDREVISSGPITADATVHGALSSPLINGKLQLQKASLHLSDLTAGVSNASGEVDFNGASASVRNLTGEVGGGRVVLSGFMAFRGASQMALRINATKVRIRPQPGVSAVGDADLRLSGRFASSLVSGTAALNQITYAPHSDPGRHPVPHRAWREIVGYAVAAFGQHETRYTTANLVRHARSLTT
jgi:autotransporter translocation and assembly factor TamB